MISALVTKELKQTSGANLKGSKKIFNIIASLIILCGFILIEIFVYSSIFDKVSIYDKFNDSLFIIIEFALMVIGIVGLIPFVIKRFFGNPKEKTILATSPITTYDIILAKGVALYLKTLTFSLSSIFVIGCVYGYKCKMDFIFYILAFLISLLISLFILGFAMLLTIPCYSLLNVIKRYKAIIILTTILAATFIAVIYGYALHIFIDLVRDANLDKIFNSENVIAMSKVAKYLYPMSNMINYALEKDMAVNAMITILSISGLFFIAFFIFKLYLDRYYNSSLDINKSRKDRALNIRIYNPKVALIRKELSLALSSRDGIFSFLTLLILQPFLIYGVISAVNLIFATGNFNYISTLFPAVYISVDSLLILLFISVINMTSSISLNKEKETLIIMKTMPISFKKQLLVKLMVSYLMSIISYLVTMIVLVSTHEINWISFLFLLVIGAISILLLNIASVFNDLTNKNNSLITILLAFIAPIVLVGIGIVVTFIVDNVYDQYIFFGIILLIDIILLAVMLTFFLKLIERKFLDYEGGNQ